ncbi:MAG: hypothetical protein ACYTF6_15185 [Planctomycetota bacterium]|jgi:hypothetical protein
MAKSKRKVETRFTAKDQTKKGTASASKGMAGFAKSLAPVALGLGAVVAAAGAVVLALRKATQFVVSHTSEMAKQGDEIAKTAAKIGLAVEEYDALTFAAERSGASQASITTAFRTLARAATEAADGAVFPSSISPGSCATSRASS